ncbi:acyltransferase [Nonomuraea roseoviolacea subsp. roseoviolacea]|uniref:Peptidoglycan/LPS O-acetylase OafA/YrhL n=1 Tax=Nonomuraea roseoviolacea subsp. carminata TaxID=160689 RepID=A0ABT1KFN7_9ACTN|nr:acyltransferase [Nonomuraea roseoviolacea]MCP2352796.1 peptidoglycan/LPS O-acetylase OafA/YrhL [Nonomuraea roseoviolacea subsp. carminata]
MKTEHPRTGTRLLAVDNLRVALTALVVLHHVAVTYGDIPMWYYVESAHDSSGVALDVLVVVNQAFFMGFFFLISGFFTPASFDRKGGRAFVRDRLLRLGVPLLVFLLLLRPLVTLPQYLAQQRKVPYAQFYLSTWDPGPMWFAEVLIVFAVAYAVWRGLRRGGEEEAPAAPPRFRSLLLFAAGLAVATFVWRLAVPTGTYVPVLGLPSPDYLPQYVSMFAAGTVAFRRRWFETLPRATGRAGLITATVAAATLLPLGAMTDGVLSSAAMAAWQSFFAVGLVAGLVVIFRERFDRQGPLGRFLSAHAYTVYIVHPIVLVAVSLAFRWLEAAAVVKFAVVAVLSLPLCWGLAYLVRSLPGARRIL